MERLDRYQPTGPRDDAIQILRAFLSHLPTDDRRNLRNDIRSFDSDEDLQTHAKSLVEGLLYPLRTISRTTTITTSSRANIDDSIENITPALTDPATLLLSLKSECLVRDNYRCPISKQVDETAVIDADDPEILSCRTECAHIVPFSIATWRTDSEQRVKATVWVNFKSLFSLPKDWNQLRPGVHQRPSQRHHTAPACP